MSCHMGNKQLLFITTYIRISRTITCTKDDIDTMVLLLIDILSHIWKNPYLGPSDLFFLYHQVGIVDEELLPCLVGRALKSNMMISKVDLLLLSLKKKLDHI